MQSAPDRKGESRKAQGAVFARLGRVIALILKLVARESPRGLQGHLNGE